MKHNLILLFFCLVAYPGIAQLKTYSFSEIEKLEQQQPKPLFVFVHTSWCKYCKMMENSTFKNPEVIQQLNENFYFVSLDAETKNPIQFNNHQFNFKPRGQNSGVHELAEELGTIDGTITYPTFSILDKNNTILLQISDYTDAKTLLSLIKEAINFH